MKKIKERRYYRDFQFKGFVSVHREELDEILSLLKRPNGKTSIKSGGYEFEDLDELKEYFGSNTPSLYFEFEGKENDTSEVKLNFKSKSNVSLICFKEEGKLFHEIKEIIKSSYSPLKYLFNPGHILAVLSLIGLYYVFNFISSDKFSNESFGIEIFTVILLISVLIVYALELKSKYQWSIDLNTKHAANFLQRNKDKIIWAILWLFLGGFLEMLRSKFFS